MKADRYTKIILTIIAACMVINVIEKFNVMPKAYANETTEKPANTIPATNYGIVPLNEDGSINVKMTAPTDVNVIGLASGHMMS